MRLIKRSERASPALSIVLLDWSVRESFHLLHYLRTQTVDRDRFEVLLIEYYSRASAAATQYATDIDTWALLELPEECYYHKHLMYNAGIALSRGEVCVFCDSDAMVQTTFVSAILERFENDSGIVLHLDQFRNMRRDFYPFSFPSIAEVVGPGCINNVNGKTRGVAASEDPLHERNYGACMCARRADVIAIGGADEHMDYLGHICGPYDMTFRLVNLGRREVWHDSEFMYHTWHPGQAGVANYLGPHDGRHMSTTALEALASGRIEPLELNPVIAALRTHGAGAQLDDRLLSQLVDRVKAQQWLSARLHNGSAVKAARPVLYRGYRIEPDGGRFVGRPMLGDVLPPSLAAPVIAASERAVRRAIDGMFGARLQAISAAGSAYVFVWRMLATLQVLVVRAARRGGGLLHRLLPSGRAGSTVSPTGHPEPAAAARTADRWRRFVMETRYVAAGLASLLASLYFLGQIRLADAASRDPVVFVDRAAVLLYLRVLAALRLVTPVDIVRVASVADLTQWVASQSASGRPDYVVVARDLYLRHYAALSQLRARHRLVIA